LASTIHVIGAGLAGLSAACDLVERGARVVVYETGQAAGGRCRSYFDRELGCRIDNGNHLLLTGNDAAFAFLRRIGAQDTLTGPSSPCFPFLDVASGDSWTLRPNAGRIPWWVFLASRRVPGTRPLDYLGLRALQRAGRDATVAATLAQTGVLYRRLLEPLAVAALNTPPDEALAPLLAAVVRETLMRGGNACLARFPREGLSESFVDPAIAWLKSHGAGVHLTSRVVALDEQDGRVAALHLLDGPIALGADDRVVLAVPPWVAADLLPGLAPPNAFEAIVNVHFRTDIRPPVHWRDSGFIGLIGGTAEWVFAKPRVISVTISAANDTVELSADAIRERVWPDVALALATQAPMPPSRVVKEKRATFAATADQEQRRPPPRTRLQNLVLAGDWTATGLPATIEGAIRSGRAASHALRDAA
jgi:squalene-associated FAD-dependent desaturase